MLPFKESTGRWAIVAPFLAHYAVGRSPFLCRLLECSDCSFRFFDSRLEPDEVTRLYSGYRGDGYFAERHRWEFWYSRKSTMESVEIPKKSPTALRRWKGSCFLM